MKKFLKNINGATTIEYALIGSFISLIIIGSVILFGDQLRALFDQLGAVILTSE
ncbi:MAG: Flp family type IVb pilin [Pseudomonadota bacterium]